MCGIVGYVGGREATPILLEGLRRLEYRGYDSAGVAVMNGDAAGITIRKLAGRVQGLRQVLAGEPVHGSTGIAHTRWATHGAPTTPNAHPHVDCGGRIALVHNGIIENADALRAALQASGHRFCTETDTETLAHLIEDVASDASAILEHPPPWCTWTKATGVHVADRRPDAARRAPTPIGPPSLSRTRRELPRRAQILRVARVPRARSG